MKEQYIATWANLIIKKGLNLRPGQCLLINTGVGNYSWAQALAKAAYSAGGRFVSIRIQDPHLTRFRIEHGNEEYLDYNPNYVLNESYEFLAMDWARVRIEGNEDKVVLDGVDSNKLNRINKAGRTLLYRTQEALMRDHHPWIVTSAPGPKWAEWIANIGGDTRPGALERLEEAFAKIMRLDQEDPLKAWEDHIAAIGRRSAWLNDLDLAAIQFVGEGTDLTVGLCADSLWRGGSDGVLPDGRPFVANMPTEEVYTTPDWRKTTGKVRVTRPVMVMDSLVQGAWFTFAEGKVVDYGAEKGKEVLGLYLASDPGASFLGEVALVGVDSPIYQSGMVFGSILFDENASSHVALGAGYPSCLRSAKSLSNNEITKEAGCNISVVHTDFMIGSEKTDVWGIKKDGTRVQIQKQGYFTQ